MQPDPLRYDEMMSAALRGVVRKTLSIVADRGLPGEHHFYITFATALPGVQIPGFLREKYPQEMTIVLQHQFSGLEVTEHYMAVTLSFGGAYERLVVPLGAITRFVDPSAEFGLSFQPDVELPPEVTALPVTTTDRRGPAADGTKEPLGEDDDPSTKVVTLSAFRKK